MKKNHITIFTMAVLLAPGVAAAAVPGLINFQGRLLDNNKIPRNGDYAMTFRICDSLAGACSAPCAVGNPCLWTEDQTVTAANGVFAVQLGAVTPIDPAVFGGATRYLEMVVAGETLSPRERLTAGSFSFRASVADSLAPNVPVSSIGVQAVYDGAILNGAVTEGKLGLSDNTTGNVSTVRHGLAPKAPNNTEQFLRGDATWAPARTMQFKVKSADENVPTGTTLQNDNHLVFPVLAGETWTFEFRLLVTNLNSATPDWKAAILGAAGWTCRVVMHSRVGATVDSAANGTDCDNAPTALADASIVADANIPYNVFLQGWITATTDGNVQLQWAPNTSGSLTVLRGSYVIAQKVGGI